MKKVLKWIGIIIVALFVIGGIGAILDPAEDEAANTSTQAAAEPEGLVDVEPPEPEPVREEPDPNGDYDLNCDYDLGDFDESGDPAKGYRFIAGGTLINTGNIGIRVRVKYKWKRLGQEALTVNKHYRVRRDQERDVNITVPVTQGDIDAHQSADSDCSATADIVDTFGQPPLEEE